MKWLLRHKFRRTTLIMVGLTAFLAGLGLARTGWMIELLWVVPVFLLLIFSKRRKDLVTLIAALLFGLGLGWWRGAVFSVKDSVSMALP